MIQEANRHWQFTDTDTYLIMPWYTLPALKWLKKMDTRLWRVFEYGCGYSTLWWKVNCEFLKSIDSNEMWAKAMGAIYEPQKESYIAMVEGWGKYDCIIVDGEHREECAIYCTEFLKPGGVLIIDNWKETGGFDCSNIERHLQGWQCTVHQQPNHSDWRTAIFIKP